MLFGNPAVFAQSLEDETHDEDEDVQSPDRPTPPPPVVRRPLARPSSVFCVFAVRVFCCVVVSDVSLHAHCASASAHASCCGVCVQFLKCPLMYMFVNPCMSAWVQINVNWWTRISSTCMYAHLSPNNRSPVCTCFVMSCTCTCIGLLVTSVASNYKQPTWAASARDLRLGAHAVGISPLPGLRACATLCYHGFDHVLGCEALCAWRSQEQLPKPRGADADLAPSRTEGGRGPTACQRASAAPAP